MSRFENQSEESISGQSPDVQRCREVGAEAWSGLAAGWR